MARRSQPTAAPFIINDLPIGTVPSSGDLVSMSQAGTAVAVTYGQLLNGIAGIPNINLTQALVTPAGATTVQTLGQLTAAMLPLSGGTLTGGLTLSGTPTGSDAGRKQGLCGSTVCRSFAVGRRITVRDVDAVRDAAIPSSSCN